MRTSYREGGQGQSKLGVDLELKEATTCVFSFSLLRHERRRRTGGPQGPDSRGARHASGPTTAGATTLHQTGMSVLSLRGMMIVGCVDVVVGCRTGHGKMVRNKSSESSA